MDVLSGYSHSLLYLHLKKYNMLKKIIGPSPAVFVIKKVGSSLFCRGGSENTVLQPNQYTEGASEPKPPRITQIDLNKLLQNKVKRKLTKNEKLIKDVVERAELSRAVSEKNFKNLEEMYEFVHKYKGYLRLKRFIPLSIVAPFTSTELSKMAYATALGSKSIVLTIPGVIGYSLPAYFFFHMSYFYAPDKFKQLCQAGKYTFGAGFMLVNFMVDGLAEPVEEKIFGEAVPIDINKTGGTIPSDIGTIDDLRKLLEDLKQTSKEFGKKTY